MCREGRGACPKAGSIATPVLAQAPLPPSPPLPGCPPPHPPPAPQVICQFPLLVAGGAPVEVEVVAVAERPGAYINEATLVADGAVPVSAEAELVAEVGAGSC